MITKFETNLEVVRNDNIDRQNEERGRINSNGRRVRGKDIFWKDYESFDNVEDYFASDLYKKLKDEFCLRRRNKPASQLGKRTTLKNLGSITHSCQ